VTPGAAPTRSEVRVEARKRRRRGNWLSVLAAVFAAAALGAVVSGFLVLSQDLSQANAARDALARQVESLGETPVAGPPGSRGETGKSGVGVPGPSGPPGPTGAAGKDAPTITSSPGPSGPAGPAGADSTVAGPTGPAGATGAAGQNGQDGKDGTNGTNGAPPSEWTYTDQDGNEYRCVPADNFDPDNPRYRCTQTSTASPEPTPSPSPSQQPSPSDSSSGLLPLNLLDRHRN
jgi:hypothetical protein